jgi:anti-sigma B factor antagonist
MSDLLSLEVRRQGDATFVRFADLDRLDEYNSHASGEELCRLAESLPRCRLVLDLANIRYATSSALGQLVALNRRVRSVGGHLVLANLSRAVAEAIAVTHLDKVLEVCPPISDPLS